MNVRGVAAIPIGKGFWYVATPYAAHPFGPDAAVTDAIRTTSRLLAGGVRAICPLIYKHPIAMRGEVGPTDPAPAAVDRYLIDAAAGLIVLKLDGWEAERDIAEALAAFDEANKPVMVLDPKELTTN